jgi:hypothetical protein
MQPAHEAPSVSPGALWTGRILGVLVSLFFLLDGCMKLVKPEFVVKGTVELGFAEDVILPLGVVLLTCTVLYMLPPTSVLGAILLTGYLGGAVATHVHADHDLFRILFPVFCGALVWSALVLRDRRLRSLVPWRSGGTGVPAS